MDKLLLATMLLIAVQAALIGFLIVYIKRWGSYSTAAGKAKEEIAALVTDSQRHHADAQRSYHLLEVATNRLVEELYKTRQALSSRPPRFSPPDGTPSPSQRSA